MIKIYLAYTRSDFDFVRKLTHDLEKLGLSYWLDIEHIKELDDPRPLIRNALEECQMLFLICSNAAMESKRIQSEYTYFLSKNKMIIPLLVERNVELPPDLAILKRVDFTLFDYERSIDSMRRELVMALQGIRRTTSVVVADESTTYELGAEQIKQAVQEAEEDKLKTSKISIDGTETIFNKDTILELRVAQYNAKVFEYPLKEGQSYIIGRADNQSRPDVDLSLFDAVEKGVSRRHAELRALSGRLYISDLSSRNYSFLNDERLQAEKYYLVTSGDVIRLGTFALTVEFLQKNVDYSKL